MSLHGYGNLGEGRVVGQQRINLVINAATHGDLETVKSLVEGNSRGRSIKQYGEAAIYYAAANGHADILEYFLSRTPISRSPRNRFHSSLTQEFKNGTSPLHIAAKNGHLEAVKMLLKYDANPDVVEKYTYGAYTPADLAFCNYHFDVYDALVKAGATESNESNESKCSRMRGDGGRVSTHRHHRGGAYKKTRKARRSTRRRRTGSRKA